MYTIEHLKQYGKYVGFSERHSAYVYVVNHKVFTWNGRGVNRITY